MTLWARLSTEVAHRAAAVLRIFRRQTIPVHPLPVLPPRQFELPALPLDRTIRAGGREISLLGSEGGIAFPAEIYANVINRGVARAAEWAHVVTADRESAEQLFETLFPSSPLTSSPLSPPASPPEFLVHATPDRENICR